MTEDPASDHTVCEEYPYGTPDAPCSLPAATATSDPPTLPHTGIESPLFVVALILVAVGHRLRKWGTSTR